ncbi:MAG: metallophosphoesterase [Oscillospiraceae bacterium]|nr:metallophosphoesterase [Oscillospiraceae bacterium]
MKLIVIADIHSNHIALESAIKMIDEINPDGIIFLGDYVTDCPYPQKTMKLLYLCIENYQCWFIRGNREDYLLNHQKNPNDGWCYSSSVGSLLYTYENLTKDDLRFFADMPLCRDIEINGSPVITACHSSPASTTEWIKDKPELLDKYIGEIKGDILLCGHTHRIGLYRNHDKTVLFCPSFGLPQDMNSDARFTVLELMDGKWSYKMLSIEIDIERLISEFEESGLSNKAPVWSRTIIKLLIEKRDAPMQCVSLAWDKAKADNYSGGTILPEAYWNEAAKELGI